MIRATKVIPDLPVTLTNCPSSSSKQKTWTRTHSKRFPVSFQVSSNSSHFLHSPGRLQWLNTCSTQAHPQLQLKTTNATWCIWEIKTNIPKQAHTVHSVISLTFRCQTNNINAKFYRAFSAMTVTTFLSLSLSALQCLNCQAKQTASNVSSKVTSAYVRPGPLFLHTTEPQVFNYSRLISKLYRFLLLLMWQSNSFMNQGPCQSTVRPSRFLF